jgi:hypothetical protein
MRPDLTDDAWPVLSDDGKWIAWVDPTTPGSQGVILQSIETPEMRTISSTALASDRLRLLGLDTERAELLIARRNYEEALAVSSSDGTPTWGPVEFGDADWKESVVSRILRRGTGWIAWYGHPQPNTVHWSLLDAERTHHVASGTRINSVDMSPDGAIIALGTDGDFIGSSIESAVYVLDSKTGEEIFRKYFPRRCWIKVAFLGNDRLAYSVSPPVLLVPGTEFKVIRVMR